MRRYLISRMQKINALEHHHTSLSLQIKSCRRLRAALCILRRNGVDFSESELLGRLAKEFLQRWRGAGAKSATARRYNQGKGGYRVRPWYVDRVLYSLLWQRALHSGESVSRMLDFAIRFYLPRLVETLLRNPKPGKDRLVSNWGYWRRRSLARSGHLPQVFINYQCKTMENKSGPLNYLQQAAFIPKGGLSPYEILHWLRHAA